jgi:phosphoserine phosphatase
MRVRAAMAQKERAFDLVAFDMDGTLVDYPSCWDWVHHHFEVDNETALTLFVQGQIDDSEFMRRDIALWTKKRPGIRTEDIEAVLEDLPLRPGIKETVGAIKREGAKAVIVTGGMDLVAERLVKTCGFDDYMANGLEADGSGRLTGEGVLRVRVLSKDLALASLMSKYGVRPDRVACVGDSFVDVSMFKTCAMSIAYNPVDEAAEKNATFVVRDRDLRAVLPHLLAYVQDR